MHEWTCIIPACARTAIIMEHARPHASKHAWMRVACGIALGTHVTARAEDSCHLHLLQHLGGCRAICIPNFWTAHGETIFFFFVVQLLKFIVVVHVVCCSGHANVVDATCPIFSKLGAPRYCLILHLLVFVWPTDHALWMDSCNSSKCIQAIDIVVFWWRQQQQQ